MREIEAILNEVDEAALATSDTEREALATEIAQANGVFVAGAGRSGLAIRAFANRLMHLGLDANVVGDITCRHTKPHDLLVIGSGSGETTSLTNLARKAKDSGLRLALVTTNRESTIGKLADTTLVIPARSKTEGGSVQPMASTFEQAAFLTYDSIVLLLMAKLGETGDTMYTRHADLE